MHISELADHKVESPEEVVKVGDEIEVRILRVDAAERKIGLSRKQLNEPLEDITDEAEAETTEEGKPRERELRGGTGTSGGQLFTMPESTEKVESRPEKPPA